MKSISASVGVGGRNVARDVRTVQGLLNEARSSAGPPALVEDGLVGPKTVAAIRAFQQSRFGKADGRVDPAGPTILALNAPKTPDTPAAGRVRCGAAELSGGTAARRGSRLGVSEDATSDGQPTPKDVALTHKPEALVWLGAALTALQAVRTLMQSGLTADLQKLRGMLEFQALDTHFHVDRAPNPLKLLSDLGRTYTLMNIAVSGAETNFENDPTSDDFANADPGGFHRRSDAANPGRIFFCRKYIDTGPLTRVVTIVHEAAHYVDTAIDHFASAVPFPDGRPIKGSNGEAHSLNYAQLSSEDARRNAASYACFAIHTAKRRDMRPLIGE